MKIISIFFIICAIFLLFWLILMIYIIGNEYKENCKINSSDVYQVNINWQIRRTLIKANTSKTLPYRFIGTYKECINFILQYKNKS